MGTSRPTATGPHPRGAGNGTRGGRRGRGMQSRAPRRWRGGAMRTSRPTAKPHEVCARRRGTGGGARRRGTGGGTQSRASGKRGHGAGWGKGNGWWMRRDSNPQPFGVDPKSTAYASSATHPRYQLCAKRKECRVLSARGAFLRNAKTILKEGRNGQGKPFGAGMCGGRSCMSGKKQVQSFHQQKRLEDASRVQIIGRKA